jgi:hypothetical protein
MPGMNVADSDRRPSASVRNEPVSRSQINGPVTTTVDSAAQTGGAAAETWTGHLSLGLIATVILVGLIEAAIIVGFVVASLGLGYERDLNLGPVRPLPPPVLSATQQRRSPSGIATA